jgi:hypothetical protein
MTALEQAIRDAEKGGYVTGFMYDRLAAIDPLYAAEILLLDPKWWQALGKARGWKAPRWRKEWHRLIDNLISGKDVNSFFEALP